MNSSTEICNTYLLSILYSPLTIVLAAIVFNRVIAYLLNRFTDFGEVQGQIKPP